MFIQIPLPPSAPPPPPGLSIDNNLIVLVIMGFCYGVFMILLKTAHKKKNNSNFMFTGLFPLKKKENKSQN